ncbi:hypothetical protein BC938DRAFT_471601 [Jimgerdemannia flammicorona]|uniref:Rap-GAP domain-containing protein n=1 Tax=Jimgerdemannia flammicorona TaxID=994334 RepID=A0A433Q7S3_9FUNG|nr:hypothetical protein BC938DRAFT_471601 [Jimgerdemannia flammicorona]
MSNNRRPGWPLSLFRAISVPTTPIETILNPTGLPSGPLDARPVIPLLSSHHPLSHRIRLLKELGSLFERYTFTRIDDVWVAVEDLLAANNIEARHEAFNFMTACIEGQYGELGMARVVFYNAVRNHAIWDDFVPMFTVLFKLTKEGRDISLFEKNIVKLLASWLDSALRHAEILRAAPPSTTAIKRHSTSNVPTPRPLSLSQSAINPVTAPVPHLQPILNLITLVVKFNPANFEQRESTDLVHAIHRAFGSTRNPDDARFCINFLDVLVRFGSCPPPTLSDITDILCRTINWDAVAPPGDHTPPGQAHPWAVFQNLLRSHYAQNAVRIMCERLRKPASLDRSAEEEAAVRGALTLLGRAVWETRVNLSMVMTNVVLLVSMRAAVARRWAVVDEEMLRWMNVLVDQKEGEISSMEWDVLLDIAEDLARYVLGTDRRRKEAAAITRDNSTGAIAADDDRDEYEAEDDELMILDTRDNGAIGEVVAGSNNVGNSNNEQFLCIVASYSKFIFNLQYLHMSSSYEGSVPRYMALLHTLRRHLSGTSTIVLLDYYEREHLLYPSSEDWLTTLAEVADTFYCRHRRSPRKTRLRVLQIVADIYMATKDFYSDDVLDRIVIPMVRGLARETEPEVTQQATDLVVQVMQECEERQFGVLLKILSECATCRCVESRKPSVPPGGPFPKPYSASSSSSNRHSLTSTPSTSTNVASGGFSVPVTPTAPSFVPPSLGTSTATTIIAPPSACRALPAAQALTGLLEHSLYRMGLRTACTSVFKEMIAVASHPGCHTAPRIAIFACLSSLRCRPDHRIYISPDHEQLPTILGLPIPTSAGIYLILRAGSVSGTVNEQEGGGRPGSGDTPKPGGGQALSDKNLVASVNQQQQQQQQQRGGTPISRKESMRDILSEAKKGAGAGGGAPGGSGEARPVDQAAEKAMSPELRRSPFVISPRERKDPHESPKMWPGLQTQVPVADERMVELPIGLYLVAVVELLKNEREWDVFSYVLHQLSVQLACKHLFCGTTKELRLLRELLCDQILDNKENKFAESVKVLPHGLKRPDTYILAFQLLTVLISYRRIFLTMSDQNEITYAFYHGLQKMTNATKLCINALTVCCHEMPQSATKYLPIILTRLGQIISVASTSVHILELLSSLARLPNLYQSFTESDFKRVFAIAIQYIHNSYAAFHAQQTGAATGGSVLQSGTTGNPPGLASPYIGGAPNNNASLPQPPQGHSNSALSAYVLIMAFHVIEIWFIAVPLRDRRRHVSFIVRGLLAANAPAKSIDEQTLTCIDMLARYTYSDCELRPERNLVADALMGGKEKDKCWSKTWVQGMSLMTVRTNKTNGWADLTVRRPSGVVSMMIKVENPLRIEQADWSGIPAMLMMHYTGGEAGEVIESGEGEGEDSCPGAGVGIDIRGGTVDGGPLGIELEGDGEDEQDQSYSAPPSRRRSQDDDAQMEPRRSDSATALPIMSPQLGVESSSRIRQLSFSRPGAWFGLGVSNPEETTGYSDSWGPTSPFLAFARNPVLSPARIRGRENAPEDTPPLDGEIPIGSRTPRVVDTMVKEIFSEPVTPSENMVATRRGDSSTDPSFLFLQLGNYPDLNNPLSAPLPDNETTTRSIAVLDRMAVVDFHKIAVLYVGRDQTKEVDILSNQHGSPDYITFLNSLGTITRLRGNKDIYTGGLDTESDIDGEYAYYWKDAITQLIFHVATMMPFNERDPQRSLKKRHLGNDFVTIVYNDSGRDYVFGTCSSEFNFIEIVISPHSEDSTKVASSHNLQSHCPLPVSRDYTFFKVVMQRRSGMPEIGPITEFKMVSFATLPHFIRQMAMHANIFAQIFLQFGTEFGSGGKQEYLSNWRSRLRQIKQIRDRALGVTPTTGATGPLAGSQEVPAAKASRDGIMTVESVLDFTKYT